MEDEMITRFEETIRNMSDEEFSQFWEEVKEETKGCTVLTSDLIKTFKNGNNTLRNSTECSETDPNHSRGVQ